LRIEWNRRTGDLTLVLDHWRGGAPPRLALEPFEAEPTRGGVFPLNEPQWEPAGENRFVARLGRASDLGPEGVVVRASAP
jgi:hypothetical protein